MKVLIVSSDYPLPEDKGSRIRTMHFARFFKERGEVDVMCYSHNAPKKPHPALFRKEFYLQLSPAEGNFLDSLRAKLIEGKPWIVNSFGPETIRYVHDVITSERYDAILCRYCVNAYPLLLLPDEFRRRVILDVDDLVSGDLYDVINVGLTGVARVKAAIDKVILRRYERRCLQLGKVLFCSEEDRSRMVEPFLTEKMFVVPNVAPTAEIPLGYRSSGYGNNSILFVGALSYPPNENGIIWFIENIYQKLPGALKDLRLLVVGKDPKERLKEICSAEPNIDLVESPPEVLPYYETCRALVVPLLVGGGTRIKILEAGKYLRPVLATAKASYGLGLEEGKEILHFSDAESFVDKLRWLEDEANYRRVTDGLGRVVRNRYSEDVFVKAMSSVMASA